MDDRRAALLLSALALVGAGVRYGLSPRTGQSAAAAPGDVRLMPVDTPPESGLAQRAHTAERLSRPLLPGERVDLDRADVTEITRLPRVGPSLAERIVAWRTEHGPFGSLERLDSVPGVGPRLLDVVRRFVTFSGVEPPAH
ncbi:MAG TPA: helix-hairpin-helix domain-containing protein [Gemmatimonadales bacterium]|nr:helix-hairpin-helix domain-containing protein [Gemmatimonadales bacterium]